ncbi:MAG: exo-alpha-sialidase [Planctomycetes bacterium]|nr:exo-alpha-sialidase [Planctomycetota bacterium]
MSRQNLCTTLFALLFLASTISAADKPTLLEARKIWDRGGHNAFTDLVRHNNRWYCVFREAKGHVSPEGKIRVLTSSDGKKWTSAALLSRAKSDLRDPKINVAPDGRLMVLGAASWHEKTAKVNRQPMVWFSKDGKAWSEGVEVAEPNFWLWRVTWHKGVARGIGYGRRGNNRQIRLYESRDGVDYKTLVSNLFDKGYPNETSIIYQKNDTALCLLRRDGKPNTGLLGTSQPPYTKWTWKDLGVRIGGPHMIQLPDGRLLAATRLYDKPVRTALSWLDPKTGTLKEFLTLPSGGDTSYPGLVWHDGVLWVSYYASHEGKTSIYLARVKL